MKKETENEIIFNAIDGDASFDIMAIEDDLYCLRLYPTKRPKKVNEIIVNSDALKEFLQKLKSTKETCEFLPCGDYCGTFGFFPFEEHKFIQYYSAFSKRNKIVSFSMKNEDYERLLELA